MDAPGHLGRLEVTISEVEEGRRVCVHGIPTNSAGIVPGFETCLLVLVGDRLTVERWQVEGMCDL